MLSNSIQQLSDHTPPLCLWSVMADRKCTHAHWRQCVKTLFTNLDSPSYISVHHHHHQLMYLISAQLMYNIINIYTLGKTYQNKPSANTMTTTYTHKGYFVVKMWLSFLRKHLGLQCVLIYFIVLLCTSQTVQFQIVFLLICSIVLPLWKIPSVFGRCITNT